MALSKTVQAVALILVKATLIYTACTSIPVSAHFSVAPKIKAYFTKEVAPEKPFIKEAPLTRGEFLNYLDRLTAFDTKYDRVQPKFYAHFNLIRGVALAYPENVHDYIDTLTLLKTNTQVYQNGVKSWFSHQAELFSLLTDLYLKAEKLKLQESHEYQVISRFYSGGVKAAFLEELVVLGNMPATQEGLIAHINALPSAQRQSPNTGIAQDTELTPIAEQTRMKKRWVAFRKDLLKNQNIQRYYKDVKQSSLAPSTLLAKIGNRSITLGDFNHQYGKLEDNRFASQKKANIERLIFYVAASNLFDSLGFSISKVNKNLLVTHRLILMAMQLSKDAFGTVKGVRGAPGDLAYVRDLQAYPKILEVKDWISASIVTHQLDDNFFDPSLWVLERTLEPQHSVHL